MAISNFYIGQKVRYLNQTGEGTITKITPQNIFVEDVSGFEIPFQAKELVPSNVDEIEFLKQAPTPQQNTIQLNNNNAKKIFSNGLYLLFAHVADKGFEVLLLNQTGYDTAINFYLNDNHVANFQKNIFLKSDNFVELAKISKEEIGNWQSVSIQMLFSRNHLPKLMEPVSVTKKIDGKKVFEKSNYVLTKYHHAPVFDVCIYSDKMSEDDIVIDESIIEKMFQPAKAQPHVSVANYTEEELIIDLHIEELIENFTTYTPSTLMQIQINKVKAEIDKAYLKNRKKITFIHGVGKGVLKAELTRVLSTMPKIKFYDAPYSKFGFGATVVELH